VTGGGLVEVREEDWDPLLARLRCEDVYLTRAYLEGARTLDPGEPVLLHHAGEGGEVVLAALVRRAPGDTLDVTTPYGYGGPVGAGPDPPLARFYELYGQWCAQRGIVSTFLRFHPLFANAAAAGLAFHVERVGTTVSWRLDGEDDLLAGMHPTHRNKVRKAERAGARVEIVEAPAALAEFAELYRSTMARLEAAGYYDFPEAYWASLCTDLRDRLTLVAVRLDGELAAAALFLAGGRWLHYHLSASSERGRRTGATNLLLLEAARYGRRQGFELLHLGGGVGGREDSLFAFKAHFCPGRGLNPLHVGKAVHDAERYLALAGGRAISYSGFFPAYRRPPG
jgi:serine/alanine adding enzyme